MFNIDLRRARYTHENGATWLQLQNGKIQNNRKNLMTSNIELIKSRRKGTRSGNIWYIHRDTHREWCLPTKAHAYTTPNFNQPPFKWIRWVGEDEFPSCRDGKLAKYDLQNRLTMIPMPEGVTRINELKIQVTNSWQ